MNEPAKTVKTIRTVKEFIDWLEEVKGPFVLYRGLPDAQWEVESSGYRRIKPKDGEAPPRVFQNYIERLLDRASLQGFRERGGVQRSDLELLAELQHNGSATCLIDFTENALVALWFVCREKPEKAGKVVAMATKESEDFFTIDYKVLKTPIEEFLNQGKLWKWKPSNLSNRIVAQGSVFVFGERIIEKKRWYYEEIEIDANSKQEIREELKEKFGISEESLFSDFTGFAQSNAHDSPYSDYTVEDYVDLGVTFIQIGDFRKAIHALGQAIDLSPEHTGAYRNRGVAKRNLGDISGAIVDFNKALELNPQYAEAYAGRGIAKRIAGDHQGAIADLTQAIDLNLQIATVFYNRGLARYATDDYLGAITDYDIAINLVPEFIEAYRNLGVAKRNLGDISGAIVDFNKALELNPQYAEAYAGRGIAKRIAGDHQGAIADLTQAVDLNLQIATVFYNRGLARYATDDYLGAITDFNQANELNPQDVDMYYNRGLAKRALGDDAGAQADFAKAKELDPSLEPPESP